MTETATRPLEEEPSPSDLGGGGAGRGDDDPGDGWGWSGDPGDGDDEVPYRRSRILRTVALITTITFVAASIGTGVAIVASGDSANGFAVRSIAAATVPTNGSRPLATVHFTVTNTSTGPSRARCVATVGTSRHPSGSAEVTTARLTGGARVSASVVVPLRGSSAPIRPVEVHCVAVPVHG